MAVDDVKLAVPPPIVAPVLAAVSCLAGWGGPAWAGDPDTSNVGVLLSPEPLYSHLDARVVGAEVDLEHARITWTVDGSVAGHGQALPARRFARGDHIRASVVLDPPDGRRQTAFLETQVRNAPPTVTSAWISPAVPHAGRAVTCDALAADPDGDRVNLYFEWRVNQKPVDAGGRTLDGAHFSRDDTLTCVVTPSDGRDMGPPVEVGQTVGNAPPVIRQASIGPDPLHGDDDAQLRVDAHDPDGDDLRTSVTWKVNGREVGSGTALSSQHFRRDDRLSAHIEVDDGQDTTSQTVKSRVQNRPPVITDIAFQPEPNPVEPLTCHVEAEDPDGDRVRLSYAWTLNGEPVGGDQRRLGAAHLELDDQVSCTAIPRDDRLEGEPRTIEGTVAPRLPRVRSAAIEPATLRTGTDATARGTAYHPDGYDVEVSYRWAVDGEHMGSDATLDARNFSKGQTVEMTVVAETHQQRAEKTIDTVVANTPPEIASISLDPAQPLANEPVTCKVDAVDPDGDDVEIAYRWTLGGRALPDTGRRLDGSQLGPGPRLRCSATPSDGEDTGPTAHSDAIQVPHRAPIIHKADIGPEPVHTAVNAQVDVEADDPDGGTVRLDVRWSVNGRAVGRGTELASHHYQRGDTLTARVVASDGTMTSEPTTVEIEVGNAPPVVHSVAIEPHRPEVGRVVSCQAHASDPDGDELEIQYTWLVDGSQVRQGETLSPTWFDEGDEIACRATARDHEAAGHLTTDPVAARQGAPFLAELHLPDGRVSLGDVVEPVALDWRGEPDLTSHHTYRWYRRGPGEGRWSLLDEDAPRLDTRTLEVDDELYLEVVPGRADGATGAPMRSNTITVSASPWTAVAGGGQHTCATLEDGSLWCWGRNDQAQLATTESGDRNVPTRATKQGGWQQVALGSYHSCATQADGSGRCWGMNNQGQLGDGGTFSRAAPVNPGDPDDWKALAAGGYHACGIRDDGTLSCWGSNSAGQLGDRTNSNRPTPAPVAGNQRWQDLSAGGHHTCAINNDGHLWCWGSNNTGQIGDGSRDDHPRPTRVRPADQWKRVVAGSHHTCAIRADDTLWCWGGNQAGQLGDGSRSSRPTPVQVQAPGGWADIALGQEHTCGVRVDGTAWCWGGNGFGQLGLGTQRASTVPVELEQNATWTAIGAGQAHTCAIRDDGGLWCWGRNNRGQTGTGDDEDHASPAPVAPPQQPTG